MRGGCKRGIVGLEVIVRRHERTKFRGSAPYGHNLNVAFRQFRQMVLIGLPREGGKEHILEGFLETA